MLEIEGTQALARLIGLADAPREEIEALRSVVHLLVLYRGSALLTAGQSADAISVVVTGRFGESGCKRDYGPGDWVGTRECICGEPALETVAAIRESVVLQLARDQLAFAAQASPSFARALYAKLARGAADPPFPPPARLLVASADHLLADEIATALLPHFEQLGNVRLIRAASFGAGLPGGISLGAWEARHELQEQEQAFDLTVTVLDTSDEARAKAELEEADEILFAARAAGELGPQNPWLRHALAHRGGQACRALLSGKGGEAGPAVETFRSVHVMRETAEASLSQLAGLVLGRGLMLSSSATGVHAAAVWGALQAVAEAGVRIHAAGAAGGAILPVALFAAGAPAAAVERVFAGLTDAAAAFRKAQRPAFGLYEARPLDEFLVHMLPDTGIAELDTPFIGVTANLSVKGAAHVHRTGKLRALVRSSLTPPGLFPPIISEDGDIIVSGAQHAGAVVSELRRMSPCEILLIETEGAALGRAEITYRDLTAGLGLGLRGLGLGARQDRRLALETQLAELSTSTAGPAEPCPGVIRWRIAAPPGVGAFDWSAWRMLHDLGYDHAKARLADLAGHLTPAAAGATTSEAA